VHADWTEIRVSPLGLKLVARLSTLVFLGEDRCRDDAWVAIIIDYILQVRNAMGVLRAYPVYLRRIANIFLPVCRQLRAKQRKATDIISAEVERRRLAAASNADTESNNLLAWYDKQHRKLGGKYDPASAQLLLSFAAILTTTDLLCQVILDLAEHPELIQPLRDEISSIISTMGWKKTALYKLGLLDSVIKETQRLKPVQIGKFGLERGEGEDHARLVQSGEHAI
jgi:cytochrome P450